MTEQIKTALADRYGVDAYLRMKDLANIPERQPKTHTYKTGANKGKVRVIGARRAIK